MFTKVVAEVGVLVLLGASTLLAQAGDATSSGSGGGESSGSSSSSSSEGGDASGGRSSGSESSGGGDGGTSGSSDTGDSSSDTGDSTSDTGDSSSDTGDSTSETGDSGPRFGDSGTGDAGRRDEPAAQPVEVEDGPGQAILGTFAALLLAIVASALIAVSIRERGRQADPP